MKNIDRLFHKEHIYELKRYVNSIEYKILMLKELLEKNNDD